MNKLKLKQTIKITIIATVAFIICSSDVFAQPQPLEAFRFRLSGINGGPNSWGVTQYYAFLTFKQFGTPENPLFYITNAMGDIFVRIYDNDGNYKGIVFNSLGFLSPNPVIAPDTWRYRPSFGLIYEFQPFFGDKYCFFDTEGIFVFDELGDTIYTEYYGRRLNPYYFLEDESDPNYTLDGFELSNLPGVGPLKVEKGQVSDPFAILLKSQEESVYGVRFVNTYNINGDTTNYLYYYKATGWLFKASSSIEENTVKPVFHSGTFFPLDGDKKLWHMHNGWAPLVYDSLKGEIWQSSWTGGSIIRHNVITDETIVYMSEDFPIETYGSNDVMEFGLNTNVLLVPDENGNSFPVVWATNNQLIEQFGYEADYASCLLFLKDGVWDTVKIEIDAPGYWIKDTSRVWEVYNWPVGHSKVAIIYTNPYYGTPEEHNWDFTKTILLYDFSTNEFSLFILPDELFVEEFITDQYGKKPVYRGQWW